MKTAKNFLFVLLPLLVSGFSPPLLAGDALQCAVCGMPVKANSKTRFDSTRDGKPVTFCSFSCAHGFHKKFPKEHLEGHDFDTGQPVYVQSAFFLAKSENIFNLVKELEFGMQPTVVAFAKEGAARKVREQVRDGEVIKGFEALQKLYE